MSPAHGLQGILSVGISDLIAHRECPRRAAYGARRHTGEGTQTPALMTPEAGSPATSYGSAIHDVIDYVADGYSDDQAIEKGWGTWGRHLQPSDLQLLKADLELHHTRDFPNTRLVLAEGEISAPLTTTKDGREIWFRARIDRLYEDLDNPGRFIHVDYKSSKWIKTEDEVNEDPQMWSYNWVIHEAFPECEQLDQWLDQLRGGMEPTAKTVEQRAEIREFLEIEARRYFEERDADAGDGLPDPAFNQWCPWCPILESCQIIPRLTDWALSRIATLRPEELKAEDGEDVTELLEAATPIDEYFAQYDDAQTAIKTLERYVESAKSLVHELPEDEITRHGFKLQGRSNSVIPVGARGALYAHLGHEEFLELCGITQTKLKSITDKEQREWALSLVEKRAGNPVVTRRRR